MGHSAHCLVPRGPQGADKQKRKVSVVVVAGGIK